MFINHYDNSIINCTNNQFDYLLYSTKTLFKIYNKIILEHQIMDAMYEDDYIFYASSFLFKSKRNIFDLHKNYCNLAKLIFIYYNKNYRKLELDSIILSMCEKNIDIDLIYSEYY